MIDEETHTDFCRKEIAKGMLKVKIEYIENKANPEQVQSGEAPGLVGFQEITCHLIFNVKMDFSRKFRTVSNGSTAEAPLNLTYYSVVSRDSVSIAFLISDLNDLYVMACDLGNVYLNAPCREKIWFVACLEHRKRKGKVMVIVRALYGLKSFGSSWRAMFAEILSKMNFVQT